MCSQPPHRYVLWPRIDQKTCCKAVGIARRRRGLATHNRLSNVPPHSPSQVTTAGLELVVIDNKLEGDQVRLQQPPYSLKAEYEERASESAERREEWMIDRKCPPGAHRRGGHRSEDQRSINPNEKRATATRSPSLTSSVEPPRAPFFKLHTHTHDVLCRTPSTFSSCVARHHLLIDTCARAC